MLPSNDLHGLGKGLPAEFDEKIDGISGGSVLMIKPVVVLDDDFPGQIPYEYVEEVVF